MQTSPLYNSRTLSSLKKETPHLFAVTLHFSLPQPSAKTNLFLFEGICLFWKSYINWTTQYEACCVWLFPLTIIFSRFIHVVEWICTSFLCVCLNKIPLFLNPFNTVCLSIHQLMAIWVVFTSLAIMNNSSINICAQVFVCTGIFISFVHIPRRHMITLCLVFWGTSKLFSSDAPFHILSSNVWFQGLYIFTHTCHCLSFLLYPVSVMGIHCEFDLHFP